MSTKRPTGRQKATPGSWGALDPLDEFRGLLRNPSTRPIVEPALGQGPEAEAARERLGLSEGDVKALREFLDPPDLQVAESAAVACTPSADLATVAIRQARALVIAEDSVAPDDSRDRLIDLARQLRAGGRYDPEPEAIRRAAALLWRAARSVDANRALGLAKRRGRHQLPPFRERVAALAIHLAAKAAEAAAKDANRQPNIETTEQARRRAALAVAKRLRLRRKNPLSWSSRKLRGS